MTTDLAEGIPSIKQESLHVDEQEVTPAGTSAAPKHPPQPPLDQETATDPTGSTTPKAGLRNHVLFKPGPETHDNTGLHSAVVNFSPPSRAHWARVPEELDLQFPLPELDL